MASDTKERIAVLGGGVGALSAAFYLTEQPDWADKYEITVYQQGWRLGGKCASGHDTRPGYGHRICEHGLHIFAGFYDQAFDLLRRAYDVLERPDDHPNQGVWDAFTGEDTISLMDRGEPNDPDRIWYINFEPNNDVPGDDLTVAPLIIMVQRMVGILLRGSPAQLTPTPAVQSPKPGEGPVANLLEESLAWLTNFIRQAKDEIEAVVSEFLLKALIRSIEDHMVAIDSRDWSESGRLSADRFLLSAFLVQTIIHGIIADNVLNLGYDSLDKYEWSEWLHENAVAVAKGQNPAWGDPVKRADNLLAWAPISSLYDYVFGFGDGGDVRLPNFAAGTALRSGMLLISYRGHFFWKMRGAMGDVVIAPLYLALLKRGVKFQFLSRITQLNIDAATDRIVSVDYVQQAQLKDPGQGYLPLINVAVPGWPATVPLEGWPAEPLWGQIVNGEALAASGRDFEADNNDLPGAGDKPEQLIAGVHFEKLVLGISVGGLKQVCASFPARLPHANWGPMFQTLTITRTCAMQLWLTRTMDDLGCKGSDRTMAGSGQPYSSWSDMSHLLSRETWDGPARPLSIAYFCGQIQGPENGGAADKKAYDLAVSWLTAHSQFYWSRATSANSSYSFNPQLIYDPEPGAPGDVLTRQYIRANTNPSDLYVQSPKGSLYHRMDANQSGLDNLFLAGDWTRNGYNSGCAESAARSGWRCAQAVAGTLTPLP